MIIGKNILVGFRWANSHYRSILIILLVVLLLVYFFYFGIVKCMHNFWLDWISEIIGIGCASYS